ncbi:MAG: endonuclease MutS2 [Chloroflexi bacterium]|nr:endonuclease MutS2 [Chloroflexota bacterium]
MNDKSLEILEFPKVREILASHTSFSASRELALALKPSSDADVVSLLLKRSAEARHLLALRPGFSVGAVSDIRETVGMAAKGRVLQPAELSTIHTSLFAIRSLRGGLAKVAAEVPRLWSLARDIEPLPRVEHDVEHCISSAGEVMDSASDRLADIRRASRDARQRLMEHLEAILRAPRSRKIIQEPIITERDGRYVIPVKVEMRKDMKGIVHDVSGSGATVFVEPLATAELGNELRQLVAEEKHEVERILASLSMLVGAHEEEIERDIALAAEIDLALAKARYADAVVAVEPMVAPTGQADSAAETAQPPVLKLVQARHPLLKGKAVPLSVELGRDYSVLVITGPNTGGKTVCLKTIGLLTLMAQSGMPIPASEASCIPVLDDVFADIGDEQSIEQTLSTFSWHMGNIVRIIRGSTRRSLVLLDELGTSTDPAEGAAMAKAILLHFREQGTLAVATTHFHDLKVLAQATPGMRNASLDFDPVTLKPTYHLTLGVAGGSNAMAIAAQIGLPEQIIARAKEMLGHGSQEMETLTRELMAEKQRVSRLAEEMEKERSRVSEELRQSEAKLQQLKEEQEKAVREARDKLVLEMAGLQKEVRQTTSELKKTRSREKVEQARKALSIARGRLDAQRVQERQEMKTEPVRRQVAVGDKVWLADVRVWGTVLSLNREEGEIEVQVGNARLRAGIEEIERLEPAEDNRPAVAPVFRRHLAVRPASLELDLRGRRADAVEPELDSYLNDAFLANLSRVRIIHGVGTGVVRQIVRQLLSSHPLVKSYRPGGKEDGGDGVTVVELTTAAS